MANPELKRSLIFNHSTKDISCRVSSTFFKFKHDSVLEILYKLQETYEPHQIEELIIEDHDIEVISDELKSKLEEFCHLESLAFNRCNMKSLKNLPNFKKLQRFAADNNQLKVRHLVHLKQYPDLISLSLIQNDIRQEAFKELVEALAGLSLIQLNLFNNPITNEYAQLIPDLFFRVSSLQLIDGLDRQGSQLTYDEDEDQQEIELGRNDGEDLKTIYKIVKDQNTSQFEWSISNKKTIPPKLNAFLEADGDPTPRLKKQPTTTATTTTTSTTATLAAIAKEVAQFAKEREEEEDDDDEEFDPMDDEVDEDEQTEFSGLE